MILQIDPSAPVPIYRQLADQVVYRIASGELAEGDQLPSIRQLAVELRINPNTVIRAYRELEHAGFATSHHGLGFFVADGGSGPARREWRARMLAELAEAARRALAVGIGRQEILDLIQRIAGEGGAA